MPGIDYAAVRREIPMRRVLELLRYEPAIRQGTRLRGQCPLPPACSPRSFTVDLQRNLFHCFGCDAGGNQLDLWSALHGLPLHRAAKHLCQEAQISIPWRNQTDANHNP